MIDILGKRYWFFALSLLVILPGIIILGIGGLPLSIDFTSGSLMEVKIETEKQPQLEEFLALYDDLDITDAQVQVTEKGTFIIRSSFLDEEAYKSVTGEMEQRFSSPITIEYFDNVGPSISQKVASRAALAIGVAALAVVIYITIAFRGIPHASRYGICAIIAMIHDVAIVFSITAMGARLFGWEMDALFLTALLTIIGFSVQDKIVVFDRIRENTNLLRRLPFQKLVNHSIVQTLQRSINTQLMTVEFLLLALALLGGVTLREFAVILLVGLFSGTYSSIFIAAPILVLWENQEWRNWFGRGERATI